MRDREDGLRGGETEQDGHGCERACELEPPAAVRRVEAECPAHVLRAPLEHRQTEQREGSRQRKQEPDRTQERQH